MRKTFYIFILLLVTTVSYSQVQSGDCENGTGTYLFSNGAMYTGSWKNSLREGNGSITYPDGASEENLSKVEENETDTTYTCICQFWNPENGIVDEEKAWSTIKQQAASGYLAIIDEKFFSPILLDVHYASGAKRFITISWGDIMTGISIISDIYQGNYENAGKSAADYFIGYMFPLAGQIKTLMDGTSIAIEAVVMNWEEDLFLSKVYQNLDARLYTMYINQYKAGDPYVPSEWVRNNPELKAKMEKLENDVFWQWYSDFAQWDAEYNDNRSGFMARISSRYGNGQKELSDRDIFNEFWKVATRDHKSNILFHYRKHLEAQSLKEADAMKLAIINSVCSNLWDKQQKLAASKK